MEKDKNQPVKEREQQNIPEKEVVQNPFKETSVPEHKENLQEESELEQERKETLTERD